MVRLKRQSPPKILGGLKGAAKFPLGQAQLISSLGPIRVCGQGLAELVNSLLILTLVKKGLPSKEKGSPLSVFLRGLWRRKEGL